MEVKHHKINYESLLLIQMLIYTYSYNFHSLWLLCDMILIFNFVYLLQKRIFKRYIITFSILIFLFSYLIFTQYKSFHLISFISFWDNYKHLFLFIFTFLIYKRISEERKEKFLERLYKISFVTFFVQVFFILIQYKLHWHFDNLAGTFGNGSTHSVAYFNIAFILLIIRHKKNIPFAILVIAICFLTSFISENTGFFVLLALSLFFQFIDRIKLINLIILGLLVFIISIIVVEVQDETAKYTINKITSFTLNRGYKGADYVRPERGILMGYALYLGGLYGQGFGAYSEIYNIDGWLFHTLIDKQLCISEGTHLIAEIGILGLITTIILFITLLVREFKDFNTRAFSIIFFVLAMFHGRLLIDDRLFFFFTLILIIWYSTKNKQIKPNNV